MNEYSSAPPPYTEAAPEDTPSDNPSDTPAATIAPEQMQPGQTATVTTDEGGTFDLTIGRVLGAAQAKGGGLEVGVQLTLSNPSGEPAVPENAFGVAPTASGWDGGSTDMSDLATRVACANTRALTDVLNDVGVIEPAVDGLPDGMQPITGCVAFLLDAGDHPNRIGYYPDWSTDDNQGDPVAWWPFALPAKPAKPAYGTVYTVTADGPISSVTYSIANFNQEQITDVPGNTWSKNVGDTTMPVISAQAGDGTSTISCTITVDGQRVAAQTSHGQYAVVTCSAG